MKSTYRVIRNTTGTAVCEFHGTQGFHVGAVELVPCVPSIGTQGKDLGYGPARQQKGRATLPGPSNGITKEGEP